MGKKSGYNPETPVFLGTTNVNLARQQRGWRLALFIIFFCIDIVSALTLFSTVHLWSEKNDSSLWSSLQDFYNDSSDLIVLSFARIVCLSGLAYLGSLFAWREAVVKEEAKLKPKSAARKDEPQINGKVPHQVNGKIRNGEANGDLKEPLLGKKEVKNEKPTTTYEEWFSGSSKKDVVLFASFLVCTAFQCFLFVAFAFLLLLLLTTGMQLRFYVVIELDLYRVTNAGKMVETVMDQLSHCLGVTFVFGCRHLLGRNACASILIPRMCYSTCGLKYGKVFLMGTTVVWINAESSLLTRVVDSNRVMGRAVFLNSKRGRPASQDSRVAVVTNSVNLANVEVTEEGALRGDKGAKMEADVDQTNYLMRAVSLARGEACLLAGAFLCLLLSSVSSLILPSYQGRILDHVIQRAVDLFRRDVLLLVAFSFLTGLFEAVRNLCFAVVGKRVLKTLQDKLFMGIIIQDIAYFDGTTSGELTSRLTNDVSSMAEPVNWMLSALLRNCISLLGGFVMCFFISWKLSMLAFTTMAPIMHITAVYSRWSRELNRKRYALLAEANSAASEAIGNIRTVRAFSTEDTELERFKSKTWAAMQKGVRDAFAYAGAVAVNDWLDLGASVLILWYGGVLVMNDRLSAGKLITFQLYWNQIQSAYQSIMSVLMSLTRAAGAAQRVLSLVDALPDIDRNAGTKVSHLEGEIKLENLYFCYQLRPQHPVLSGVDLTVGKGDVCALVGRSGGGKSTIVHLLMRYYDPSQGRILLDGWDMRDLNLKSVHKHMGLVAQETQMFACSIEENITYGLSSTDWQREDMEEAARYANAHDFIMKFPEGYATRVGERGVRLSGGQRQRIAIARMLLRRPKVLLLDEATSSLDTESEALVQQALDRLIGEGGRTIVLVAHRLSTVRNADNIAVLDKGRLVEQGTHEELLMKKTGVYEKLVRRQLHKVSNRIMEDPEELESAADTIDALIDETVTGKL